MKILALLAGLLSALGAQASDPSAKFQPIELDPRLVTHLNISYMDANEKAKLTFVTSQGDEVTYPLRLDAGKKRLTQKQLAELKRKVELTFAWAFVWRKYVSMRRLGDLKDLNDLTTHFFRSTRKLPPRLESKNDLRLEVARARLADNTADKEKKAEIDIAQILPLITGLNRSEMSVRDPAVAQDRTIAFKIPSRESPGPTHQELREETEAR